jgi:hypothetical protein
MNLPASGPEKAIFLEALRQFSDACEAPALTPTCPFAVETGPSTRGCGEECMDLLAEHGADGAVMPGVVVLADGFELHRRGRARRGPDPAARAFDARELYLLDKDEKDLSNWRTVSLMFELRQLSMSSSPHVPDLDTTQDRTTRVIDCYTELNRRGFDAELLIREGIANQIATSIGMATLMPSFIRLESPDAPDLENLEAPEGWADLFERVFPEDQALPTTMPEPFLRLMAATGGAFHRRLLNWIHAGPLMEIIGWQAPSYEDFIAYPVFDPQIGEAHAWLVDHFLTTYLSNWDTASLHLEWAYLHAQRMPPCPAKEMVARRIDEADLACAIADRAASGEISRKASTSITPNQYVRYAVRAIDEGRRSLAANLFLATREVSPYSADAQNNYGFCILPDRPDEALNAFEEAARLGDRSPTNVGNRMYALMKLGRLTSALDLAEQVVQTFAENRRSDSGWMWSIADENCEEPPLLEVDDMRVYNLDLAVHIAELTGDAALSEQWRLRRDTLVPPKEGPLAS